MIRPSEYRKPEAIMPGRMPEQWAMRTNWSGPMALSSEVDIGSREENASRQ
jgi:hypothetical protein